MKSSRKQSQPETDASAQSDGLAGEFGKQAGYGNAFIQEQLAAAGKLGAAAEEAVTPRQEPDQPVGMLYIRTSFENGTLPEQLEAMGDRQVGHTWIAYVPMEGAEWVFDGSTQGFFQWMDSASIRA